MVGRKGIRVGARKSHSTGSSMTSQVSQTCFSSADIFLALVFSGESSVKSSASSSMPACSSCALGKLWTSPKTWDQKEPEGLPVQAATG